jgi:glycosyltransferase involved in cell wall biosynthesis
VADDPCVSVIIPTYNSASFIGFAIQSVLNQSYNNIEIIVVDDGSTDDTQHILLPFQGNIISIVTENKGPAHARNVGMKTASGKYIAFLDADDMYLVHKIELQVTFMEKYPDIGMVTSNCSSLVDGNIAEAFHLRTYHGFFDKMGLSYEDVYPVRFTFDFREETIPCYSGNVFKFMLQEPILMSNTAFFRRDILQEIGYQNEGYPNAQEYEFMVRICKRFPVAFLDKPTYVYRYHNDQISKVNQTKTKKTLRAQINGRKVFVQAMLDWAYSDAVYYSENKIWLDQILASKYFDLGKKWLDFGDRRSARECFARGRVANPVRRDNHLYYWFSFLPLLLANRLPNLLYTIKDALYPSVIGVLSKGKDGLYASAFQYIARVTLVEGVLKDSDQQFRCLFIGNTKMMEYLLPKMYSGQPNILLRRRILFYSLRKIIQQFRESLDMCIAVVPPRYERYFKDLYDFYSHELVQQILDISDNDQQLGKLSQKQLNFTKNKIKKAGFSYRVSHNKQDFMNFYYNMYLPLIKKNFGDFANIDSLENMEEYFSRGFLLLVTQMEQDVNGVLCWQHDDTLVYRRAGVLNGDNPSIKQGGQSAAYYFMIEEARQRKLKKLDLMFSCSFLKDGVYLHKRRWGAAVFPDDEPKSQVYFFNLGSPQKVALFYEHNPIIARTKTGLSGVLGMKDNCELSPELAEKLRKEFFAPGLEGMFVLSPNRTVPLHIAFNNLHSGG